MKTLKAAQRQQNKASEERPVPNVSAYLKQPELPSFAADGT